MANDKKIEEKLLSPSDIDKQIDELLSKKYDLQIEEAKKQNKPVRITELKLLKKRMSKDGFGNDLVDAECFSQDAVYSVFNFKTKTNTIMNGLMVDSLFGLSNDQRAAYAKGDFGKSFSLGALRFTFEYFEKEV